jgi:hypothetical protein
MFQTRPPEQDTQELFPFQYVPVWQVMQEVPFQFPLFGQTHEFKGKLQVLPEEQVTQLKPFQLYPERQPQDKDAEFQF